MRVIGIDPGKSGAWCLLEHDAFCKCPQPMLQKIQALPTRLSATGKTEIDAGKLYHQLSELWEYSRSDLLPDLVVLEKITPRPLGKGEKGEQASSGQSLLSFGITLGKIKAVLEILGLPFREVAPQTWKAAILRDTDKSKQAAIGVIQSLFPGVNLKPTPRHKPSHDWAEAVCMALYGMQLRGGKSSTPSVY